MKLASLYLKTMLEASEEITDKVGTRIYPIAATAGVNTWPFITFDHSSVDNVGTKDGHSRTITANIYAVSRSALEAEEISDMFMDAFIGWWDENHDDEEYEEYEAFDVPEFSSEDEQWNADIDSFISKVTVTFDYN